VKAITCCTTPTSTSIVTGDSCHVPPVDPPASVVCMACGPLSSPEAPKVSQRMDGESSAAAPATSPAFHES
jgi:hypothetical protein